MLRSTYSTLLDVAEYDSVMAVITTDLAEEFTLKTVESVELLEDEILHKVESK